MARVKHKRAIWHGEENPLCQELKKRYKDLKPSYADSMEEVTCKACHDAYRRGVPVTIGVQNQSIRRWWDE